MFLPMNTSFINEMESESKLLNCPIEKLADLQNFLINEIDQEKCNPDSLYSISLDIYETNNLCDLDIISDIFLTAIIAAPNLVNSYQTIIGEFEGVSDQIISNLNDFKHRFNNKKHSKLKLKHFFDQMKPKFKYFSNFSSDLTKILENDDVSQLNDLLEEEEMYEETMKDAEYYVKDCFLVKTTKMSIFEFFAYLRLNKCLKVLIHKYNPSFEVFQNSLIGKYIIYGNNYEALEIFEELFGVSNTKKLFKRYLSLMIKYHRDSFIKYLKKGLSSKKKMKFRKKISEISLYYLNFNYINTDQPSHQAFTYNWSWVYYKFFPEEQKSSELTPFNLIHHQIPKDYYFKYDTFTEYQKKALKRYIETFSNSKKSDYLNVIWETIQKIKSFSETIEGNDEGKVRQFVKQLQLLVRIAPNYLGLLKMEGDIKEYPFNICYHYETPLSLILKENHKVFQSIFLELLKDESVDPNIHFQMLTNNQFGTFFTPLTFCIENEKIHYIDYLMKNPKIEVNAQIKIVEMAWMNGSELVILMNPFTYALYLDKLSIAEHLFSLNKKIANIYYDSTNFDNGNTLFITNKNYADDDRFSKFEDFLESVIEK
ncbi:hypothetical protein TRFO_16959 [Tritrichomonas foetus]|uniref:Uncharacterized protein n=1 Tax=Tritrichomonas foetus TaxID=1144522 RepID=A0A1J4KU32_9EUKA|nr:hypothetical protein TRFO_16959 [Tritrichomonas foetus]|eukprot:OHT12997.1 hypothetical protein TRFO_16959 [Tritrichomonas foetus]